MHDSMLKWTCTVCSCRAETSLPPMFLSPSLFAPPQPSLTPSYPHPASPPNQPRPPPSSRTAALGKAWRRETTQCAAVSWEKLRQCPSFSSRAQLFLRSHSWPAPAPSTSTPVSSSHWHSPSSTSSTGSCIWAKTTWRLPGTQTSFSYLCTSVLATSLSYLFFIKKKNITVNSV